MPTAKKKSSTIDMMKRKKMIKKNADKAGRSIAAIVAKVGNSNIILKSKARIQNFLARRPHRSFQRTYRRDYARSLNMPGYLSFTYSVYKTLWVNRKIFAIMLVIYMLVTIAFVNLSSEDLYTQMRATVNESGAEMFSGVWGEIGKAGLLFVGGVTGAYHDTAATTETQVYLTIIGLLTWLTTVWLLRAILAGRNPKVRDGLYNAGAPILPTFLVLSVMVLQLLPLALALFGYSAAVASGLLDGGVEAMMFWSVASLLFILSLYWVTSTFIALIVVTLPGMYPMRALRTAGDLVIGRRLRILLRLLWMLLVVVVAWLVIAIPIILLDAWLKSVWAAIAWLPVVPLMLLVLGSLAVIWVASYVYLLYRKIVDDDALPA